MYTWSREQGHPERQRKSVRTQRVRKHRHGQTRGYPRRRRGTSSDDLTGVGSDVEPAVLPKDVVPLTALNADGVRSFARVLLDHLVVLVPLLCVDQTSLVVTTEGTLMDPRDLLLVSTEEFEKEKKEGPSKIVEGV